LNLFFLNEFKSTSKVESFNKMKYLGLGVFFLHESKICVIRLGLQKSLFLFLKNYFLFVKTCFLLTLHAFYNSSHGKLK
jgi:hypothetical protein